MPTTCFLAVLGSFICFCVTDVIGQGSFIAFKSSDQSDLCVTGEPNTTSSARSLIDCVRQCENVGQKCLSVNYQTNVTKNCALYMYIPESAEVVSGCRNMQRTNICEPPYYPLQSRDEMNCSFPFTLNGLMHFGCTTDVTITDNGGKNICTTPGCFLNNRTTAKCKPYSGFVAQETVFTVSSTVTSQPDVTTMSVFGWINIMRRKVGSGDGSWNLNWATYQNGFGFTSSYLWLGLERMYKLTTTGNWRLRFEYQYDNTWVSGEYWTFTLGDNSQSYVIHVDGYSGDDTDAFRARGFGDGWNNNDRKFTTPDRDSTINHCAHDRGWWHSECGTTHFTIPSPPAVRFPQYGNKYIKEVHVLMKAR